MTKKKSKQPIDGEWLKDVIHRRGFSVRALTNPEREGSIPYDIRTVQRAIADNEISPQLLDAIAKAIDVYPDFLCRKYSRTLRFNIMEYPEVRAHWLEFHLNPDFFPYRLCEQEAIGSRKHFMNTLLMHGVSKEDYGKLSRKEQESLEQWLNIRVTETLKHWFPATARLDQVDYSKDLEWETEDDVIDTMYDWLLENGYISSGFSSESDSVNLFSEGDKSFSPVNRCVK